MPRGKSFNCIIKEVGKDAYLARHSFEKDSFKTMYEVMNVSTIELYHVALLGERYTVYLDENGRLNGSEFNCLINGAPFYGNLVIVRDEVYGDGLVRYLPLSAVDLATVLLCCTPSTRN